MMRGWLWLVALVLAPAGGVAARTAENAQQPGMVITGDREAPLVLYIVPWQEPKASLPPDVPMQTLLPNVIDYNRSLIDDPVNRSLPPKPAAPK